MNKMWCRHAVHYYLALKGEEMLALATTQMNLEDIILNEMSQSLKHKCCRILLIQVPSSQTRGDKK
jgi:hypothetical protein